MSQTEIDLIVEKAVYANGDFRIYACSTNDDSIMKNKYNQVTIKGIIQKLDVGIEYKATLELSEIHPSYGASYSCISIYQDIPETTEGQKDYFATILTSLQLSEVYKVYTEEDDIIELIKNKTFDYNKVHGFGPVVFERIFQKVVETLEYKEILSKFGKYGITYETILKLAEELNGTRQLAVQRLEDNPYVLCEYVSGWGFKRADVVAKKMGIKHEDPRRIREGIKYTIEDNQQSGHTWMSKKDLLISGMDILQLSEDQIESEIGNTDGLKIIEDKIALQNTYNAEYNIAKRLKEMLKNENNIELEFDVDDFISRMEKKYEIELTDQQRGFFWMIKRNRVGLLIGFAGVGKSFIQKLVAELLDELRLSYSFLSPTGKAAKLLSGYTGRSAKTIHRAVGYGKEKKLRQLIEVPEDFVIVDEVSMCDAFIMNMLLSKMTNPKVRILFCGDPMQLAAIGCANLLHDFIESGIIPLTKLDIVFRQQEGGLLHVITCIRNGEQLVPNHFSGKKVFGKDFILHCIAQSEMPKAYKYYYKAFLNTYVPEDIVVITPTRKGDIGTIEINKYVQSEVNFEDETKVEHPYGDLFTFRVGDYVINTQNMYNVLDYDDNPTDIVNGDTGIIIDIVKGKDEKKKPVTIKPKLSDAYDENNQGDHKEDGIKERDRNGIIVQFDSNIVRIDFSIAGQLLHAWGMTGHRMQGSAAKGDISIADRAHIHQLSRNFIYTMLSRAREKGVLLTQAETLNRALKKVDNFRRQTFMKQLLKEDIIDING